MFQRDEVKMMFVDMKKSVLLAPSFKSRSRPLSLSGPWTLS